MTGAELPTSPRLRFRAMGRDDLDLVARLLGDERVMAFYPAPKTRAASLAWIEWNLAGYARDGYGLWLLELLDGTFVGECGLTWQEIDGVVELELGYHLLPEHQGHGYAAEAAAACRDLAAARGITRLIAIVHPDNHASRRVAERTGLGYERHAVSRQGIPVVVHGTRIDGCRP